MDKITRVVKSFPMTFSLFAVSFNFFKWSALDGVTTRGRRMFRRGKIVKLKKG
jgi:hypothetical protein